MKRSTEGFLTLYVPLYKIYLNALVDQNLLREKVLREGAIIELAKTHENLIAAFQSLNFH